MSTKLTLTIKKEIINKAKDYAKLKNRSLSDIIENYLKTLTSENPNSEASQLTPVVKSLKGAFKIKSDMDYREELRKSLEEKYF